MSWLFAIMIVLLIGGVALVAAGRGAPMAEEYDDRPDVRVPTGRPLVAENLRAVRFGTVLRGYRASEVDALLERLATQLDDEQGREGAPGSG